MAFISQCCSVSRIDDIIFKPLSAFSLLSNPPLLLFVSLSLILDIHLTSPYKTRPSQCRYRNNVPEVAASSSAHSLDTHSVMNPNTVLSNLPSQNTTHQQQQQQQESTFMKPASRAIGMVGRKNNSNNNSNNSSNIDASVMDIEDLVVHGKQQVFLFPFFSSSSYQVGSLIFCFSLKCL